jgi:hypothetical protein
MSLPPGSHKWVAIGAVSAVALLLLVALKISLKKQPESSESTVAVEHPAESRGKSTRLNLQTSPDISPRSTARATNPRRNRLSSAAADRPTSGIYVIDSFEGRRSFPPGYEARDVLLTGEGLTLQPEDLNSSRVMGYVESPPLELTVDAPPVPHRSAELPAGSQAYLELAFSADGTEWSDWLLVERKSGGNIPPTRAADTETTPPRFVRYRLSLETDGETVPLIRDVRIWRSSN